MFLKPEKIGKRHTTTVFKLYNISKCFCMILNNPFQMQSPLCC